jgi:hypothetical protein
MPILATLYFQQMWRQRSSWRHICVEWFYNVGLRCFRTNLKTHILKQVIQNPLVLRFKSICLCFQSLLDKSPNNNFITLIFQEVTMNNSLVNIIERRKEIYLQIYLNGKAGSNRFDNSRSSTFLLAFNILRSIWGNIIEPIVSKSLTVLKLEKNVFSYKTVKLSVTNAFFETLRYRWSVSVTKRTVPPPWNEFIITYFNGHIFKTLSRSTNASDYFHM